MRVRFSVRLLLAIVTLCATYLGWCSHVRFRSALLVARIEALGGQIQFEEREKAPILGWVLPQRSKITKLRFYNARVTSKLVSQIAQVAKQASTLNAIVFQDAVLRASDEQKLRRELHGVRIEVVVTAPDLPPLVDYYSPRGN
jgi:hypothetical protein